MNERVQIKPGVWIEVSARMRKASGLGRGVIIRDRLTEEERRSVVGDAGREMGAHTKYSRLLLDEAVALSKEVGEQKASEITGVKLWSLKGRKRELIRLGKYHPPLGHSRGGSRYTLLQKQQCVRLAHAIHDKEKRGSRPAFIEAGRRLGVNGRSIEWMWTQKMFSL